MSGRGGPHQHPRGGKGAIHSESSESESDDSSSSESGKSTSSSLLMLFIDSDDDLHKRKGGPQKAGSGAAGWNKKQ